MSDTSDRALTERVERLERALEMTQRTLVILLASRKMADEAPSLLREPSFQQTLGVHVKESISAEDIFGNN